MSCTLAWALVVVVLVVGVVCDSHLGGKRPVKIYHNVD